MKLFLLCFLIGATAYAGLPPTTTKSQTGSKSTTFNFQAPFNQFTKTGGTTALIETGGYNLLANPGFEATTFSTDWSASGGSLTAASGVDIGFGSKGASWDPSAASQTLQPSLVSVPAGISGANGEASIYYKTTATDFALLALDQSGNQLGIVSLPSATGFQRASLNFPFGSSTSARLSINSSSNSAAIHLDNAYLGTATNIGTTAQAQFIGSAHIPVTASCVWSRTNTALGAFGTDADCPGPTVDLNPGPGTIQTTDADLPRFTYNNLPPGNYMATAVMIQGGTGASEITCLAINDGTDTKGNACAKTSTTTYSQATSVAFFTYSAAANKTFEIYGSATASAIELQNSTGQERLSFSLVRLPSAPEISYRADLVPAHWSGFHTESCIWTRTNTAYGDFTADASCSLTQRQASNISCVATGSVLPALACTLPRTGMYYICANTSTQSGSAAQGNGIRLWDGTTTIAEGGNVGATVSPLPVCGLYNATSRTPTFTLQGRVPSGTVNFTVNSTGNGPASVIEWSIVQVGQNIDAPVLVGSVTNSSTGAVRTESAEINCDSASAITEQLGSWISSVGNISAGQCNITIATGIFSATPYCFAQPGTRLICRTTRSSATATNINCMTNLAVDSTSFDANLTCIGPR